MSIVIKDLHKGVVLAELGGYGDGPYAAKHGANAALAMLGTYIVDPRENVPYPQAFVFKPDRSVYGPYLREHIAAGRAGGAKIGVSVATVRLSHALDFLAAAEQAGADYVSLCAHSTMEMFVKERLGEELCRRENAGLLREWAVAIRQAAAVPVIFKLGLIDPAETLQAVDLLTDVDISVIHINVHKTRSGSSGLRFLEQLRGRCRCLIAGGGIQNLNDARRVLAAGADAAAIGTAAMKDPGLCGWIQKKLRWEKA